MDQVREEDMARDKDTYTALPRGIRHFDQSWTRTC